MSPFSFSEAAKVTLPDVAAVKLFVLNTLVEQTENSPNAQLLIVVSHNIKRNNMTEMVFFIICLLLVYQQSFL